MNGPISPPPTCLRGLHKAFTFTYLTDEEFLLTKLETLRDFGEICEQYTEAT